MRWRRSPTGSARREGITDILSIDTDWVWDSWYAKHDGVHHAFFLRAPRSLGDPHARHHNASIGHATSPDLVTWTVHDQALGPAAGPAWDDLATWTGCVVRAPDGRWLMFYTGISTMDGGLVQRIGVATSDDLHDWSRLGSEPVLTADDRWYEADAERTIDGVAWRDPWVYEGTDGRWHMLLTASAAAWPADTAGVIGHAVSDDLLTWEALPPLTAPGLLRCLEVPQIATVAGQDVVVFSAPRAEPEAEGNLRGDTWCAPASTLLGDDDIADAWLLEQSGLYAGRLVEREAGDWVLMGFVNLRDGAFVGVIDDPRPVDPVTLRARAGGLDLGSAPISL